LYVIQSDGSVRPGFPLPLRASQQANLTLHDLDGDGLLEMVYSDGWTIRVFEEDGSEWGGHWPLKLPTTGSEVGRIPGPPAVGDVDADGFVDLVVDQVRSSYVNPDDPQQSGYSLYLVSSGGDWQSAEPVEIATFSQELFPKTHIMLADVDGDVDLEVVVVLVVSLAGPYRSAAEVHVVQHGGEPVSGWPQRILPEIPDDASMILGEPLISDLEGDTALDVVVPVSHNCLHGFSGGNDSCSRIFAFDEAGRLKPGFPYQPSAHPDDGAVPTGPISMVTAADVNGDGRVEIFANAAMRMNHSTGQWYDEGVILGIDWCGAELAGFPLITPGATFYDGAILGDVDGDRDLELGAVGVAGIRGDQSPTLELYLYDLEGSYGETALSWSTYHGSNSRGGMQLRKYRDWRFVTAGARLGSGK
jgi:hypothetical protein